MVCCLWSSHASELYDQLNKPSPPSAFQLSDLLGYGILYVSIRISERTPAETSVPLATPNQLEKQASKTTWQDRLTYGGSRADVLGAFFNGAFLIAIGSSVFLQATERFIDRRPIGDPVVVIAVGSFTLLANCVMALVCHESSTHSHEGKHEHKMGPPGETVSKVQGTSLAVRAAAVHILGDALNTLGVVLIGVISYLDHSDRVAYADAIITMVIGLGIVGSAIPLTLRSSLVLLQTAPRGIETHSITRELMQLPGVKAVEDLRVWELIEGHAIASVRLCLVVPTSKANASDCIKPSTDVDASPPPSPALIEPISAIALHVTLVRQVKALLQSWGVLDSSVEVDYRDQ
ncbi:unnamed protein product [Parajaminaea phylloscopi]